MQVKFYPTFHKKPNSTAVPGTGVTAVPLDGEIKGDFSPLAPVITFRSIDPTENPEYTYCYIATFKRYYFCTWAFVSGQWQASMTCDALGSLRGQILASNQFVVRSESLPDGRIIDGMCQPKAVLNWATAYLTQAQIWGADYEDGTYVVGIVGNSAGKNTGAVVYYAMSKLGFSALMFAMLRSPDWMQIDTDEISENLQKALINPAQYIVSAVWLPISATTFIGTSSDDPTGPDVTQTVRLGWWEFNLQVNCRILHRPTSIYDSYSRWVVINYARHPEESTYGSWVNLAPYTKVTLDFAPFGTIDLDTTDLIAFPGILSMHIFVHAYTGDATCFVFAGDGRNAQQSQMIASLRANIGVPLPIGQIAVDVGKFQSAATLGLATGAAEIVDILGGEN